jgi:hypothetical protein
VTLAVLDSFLGDSTLASEVQSQLEITDDELKKLREISRGATERLEDAEAEDRGDYASVSELRRKAEVEIRQVLGEERTHRLFELIARRWSGGDASELAILPSAVPADTRIVINIPAFRMDLFESGQLIKSYLIGIGYPEFPLPSGLRRAEQIIFNPPWTPPDSEWVEKDKRIKPGKTIKPGDRLNPLGVMKVPIGLPSLIHGGKAPSKIGSFASHGCVGLTNAQAKDFVLHLARLGGAELTPSQVAKFEKMRTKSETVKLPNPVPVELRYETIIIEDGAVHIHRDVYDRGTNTEARLRAALEAHNVALERLSEKERNEILKGLEQMSAYSGAVARNDPMKSTSSKKNEAKQKAARTPKAGNEVVIAVAALSGKGYPSAVALDTGGAIPAKDKGRTTKKRA